MPDMIRYPVSFWIALKLHFVPRPLPAKGQARGNDNRGVFTRRINKLKTLQTEKGKVMKNLVLWARSEIFGYADGGSYLNPKH